MSDTLRRLLAADALRIVFQPIFDVSRTKPRLWAFEALTRGPEGTHFEEPNALFDYVRSRKEEVSIDRRCVAEALSRASDLGSLLPLLTVNVHASTLERDEGFASYFESAFVAADVEPAKIIVEIVEQTPYVDVGCIAAVLSQLRSFGVRIAVDDMGLGHGNFRTILDVNPEFLKIGHYFVHGCAGDGHRRALLRSAVQIAADFGAVVIAEGVEQEDDLDAIGEIGVTLVQGFLLGRPQSPAVLTTTFSAMDLAYAPSLVRTLA